MGHVRVGAGERMSDERHPFESADPNPDPEEAAKQIIRSAVRLAQRTPGGFPAIADVFLILQSLRHLAGEAIETEFAEVRGPDHAAARLSWFRTISFLCATGTFPALEQLALALSDLDRGRQPESLKPFYTGRGSGARTTHYELKVQKGVVEAADRIASLCVKDEERDAHLAECGTSKRTVERYRESCRKGWPMFWPEDRTCIDLDIDQAKSALRTFVQQAKILAEARPSKSVRAN